MKEEKEIHGKYEIRPSTLIGLDGREDKIDKKKREMGRLKYEESLFYM